MKRIADAKALTFVYFVAASVFSAAVYSGCATTDSPVRTAAVPESGRSELAKLKFRGRWWNYYERGAILMRYDRTTEAEKDFRIALGKRSNDTRWARTYGLHFLPEYFPNRELGIALLEQGKLEEAESLLSKSYRQAKSARGAFYLNVVRERRIRESGGDHEPPRIDLGKDLPSGPVGDVSFSLRFRVTDDSFVRSVTVNGRAFPIAVWEPSVDVSKDVILASGTNDFTVVAENIAGKTATRTFRITADHDGPALSYEVAQGGTELRGRIVDGSGVAMFAIDGNLVSYTSLADDTHEFVYSLTPDQARQGVRYLVKDNLGNETQGTIHASQGSRLAATQRVAMALGSSKFARWSATSQLAEARVASTSSASLKVNFLELDGGPTFYMEDVVANISIESGSALTSLNVNGEDVPNFLRVAGAQRLSRKIHLPKIGAKANVITVHATNRDEAVSDDTVAIGRKLPMIMDNQALLHVAVLDNLWVGGADAMPGLAEHLKTELPQAIDRLGRFFVVSQDDLPKILEEQELSAVLSNPKEAIRTGRIEGAEYLLVGHIRRFGPNLELIAHAINAATGHDMPVDVYGEGDTIEKADKLAATLSDRLAQAFPRAHGAITSIQRSGAELVVEIGARDLVSEALPCLVYREVENYNSVTGKSLGKDLVPIAKGTIAQVRDVSSVVRLTGTGTPDEQDRPAGTDFVVTK